MTEGTGTDPRYHAAYQRGYDGPEPERLTRAEERFRRPRRGAEPVAAPEHPEPAPEHPEPAPAVDPARALGFDVPAEEASAPAPAAPPPARRCSGAASPSPS
ncbi:hypothetical protein Q0F99_11700 [Rathayibacter oskolensis]|uniref:hypothetical protein n=1 Tax=Rathayibacter oskolensis TaxID=1891671 RepID=UPI0026603D6E|nr:hypothetical protein [Rathayibacter oskolensis]WKK70522.1 hypothetical protein Q0F99_11700 [Rathayibacter oskolensis]